jgi:hypothetical protein
VSDDAITRTVSELRRTLDDDARTPRFIQTVHRRGFRFIAPTAEVATDRPIVAGRHRELAALWRAFHGACAGERQIVSVTGIPGVGKTTLVRAFLQALQEGNHPTAVPSLDYSDNMARLEAALLNDTCAPARDLSAASTAEPLLIVLEDLHRSGVEATTLLSALGRHPEPARVMIIATYPPADAIPLNHPIASTTLLQQRACRTRIVLRRLNQDEVADYLQRRLGWSAAKEDVATLVYRQTGGHPLFVAAFVDHLVASGRLTEESPEFTAIGAHRVSPFAAPAAGSATVFPARAEPRVPRRSAIHSHYRAIDIAAGPPSIHGRSPR